MSNRFNEIGFTLEEEDACWAELVKVGLKPGANEKKIRHEIVTCIVDLTDAVHEEGFPRHRAVTSALWKLIEIFERETGMAPIVSADSQTKDGITGNFCEFAILALAPTNLVERKALGSTILAVYKEWIGEGRQPSHAPSTA